MCLYIVGSVYGALGSSVFNPLINLVGASGGVYSILCAHIADTIQNWNEFSFNSKLFHVILLTSFLALDLYMSIDKMNSGDQSVSFTAHACGGALGACLGTFILKVSCFAFWLAKILDSHLFAACVCRTKNWKNTRLSSSGFVSWLSSYLGSCWSL